MNARTGLLLKVALALLILLGVRQLWVAETRQLSSTGAVENLPLLREAGWVRELAGPNVGGVSLASKLPRDDDVYDAVDLYGNEVTAAVAKYKLDGWGALYEEHSPQTELPQLAPPKS